MRVAVRTDATVQIGTGHVKRCLSLAQALRALGAELLFVMRDMDVDAARMVAGEGFGSQLLAPPPAHFVADAGEPSHADWAQVRWSDDAAETVAVLREWRPDWVIVDHYAFDGRWERAVRDGLGCRIAAIDDIADRPHAAEILIDHGYSDDHRRKYGAHADAVETLLGGPRYALLSPAYAEAPRNPAEAPVRSVGIFMGGVDAPNFSLAAIRALRDRLGFDGAIEVATTSANPHLTELRQEASAKAVDIAVDQPELSRFFGRHELHVGAGGGATWERSCIGAPTLAIITAENQRAVLAPLARLGVVEAIEPAGARAEELAPALSTMIADAARRTALSQGAQRLVDGHGARRVAEAIRHHG